MKKIAITDLEKVFQRIVEKLKAENITDVELPFDLYRKIPPEKLAIHFSEDREYYTGSYEDDIESLVLLASDQSSVCTYVDFDRLANILIMISELKNPG